MIKYQYKKSIKNELNFQEKNVNYFPIPDFTKLSSQVKNVVIKQICGHPKELGSGSLSPNQPKTISAPVCVESEGEADVVFLLDSSGSVGPANWKTSLEFVNQLIDAFTIGPINTQVHWPLSLFFLLL